MLVTVSIITIIGQATVFLLHGLGKARPAYWCTLGVATGYAIVEGILASQPGNEVVWLFLILDAWIFGTAVLGLVRLRRGAK